MSKKVGKNSIKVAYLLIVFGIDTVFYGSFKWCDILLGQYLKKGHIFLGNCEDCTRERWSIHINQRKSINNAKSALFVKTLIYNRIFEILP